MGRRPIVLAALIGIALPAAAEDSSWVRQEVFRRLGEGVRLLREGNARKAADNLCWASERALNSHEAAWLCGRALTAAREPGRAIGFLELAVSLQPRHLGTLVALGNAYLADGQLDRARGAYFKALEVRQDHSPAYDGLARLSWRTGDEQRALELFAQALEANPADARARLNRGQLHLEAGRLTQALDDIREAARLRPDDGEVQMGLARVLLRSGLENDALAAAREASDLLPQDARPYALEAAVLLSSEDVAGAELAARRALELDDDLTDARIVLGEVLGRSGRIGEALSVLVAPDPGLHSERELERLASRRDEWERRLERLEDLERAALGGGSAAILLELARARLETGQLEQAERLALTAAEREGLTPAELRHAVYVLGSVGRALAAERLLVRLLALSPPSGDDLISLGSARELSGDPDGAREAYARALEFETAAARARLGLARLALAQGEPAVAEEQLKLYIELADDEETKLRANEVLERVGAAAAAEATP